MTCPAPPPPVNLDPRNHDPVAQTLGMEKTQDRDTLSGRMEAEGSLNSEELPPHPQSPPPPPSPRSPTSPVTPELPQPNAPTEVEARQLLVEEWGPLSGKLELPPRISWQLLFLERPLYRNLLSSPNPEGGDAAWGPLARCSDPRSLIHLSLWLLSISFSQQASLPRQCTSVSPYLCPTLCILSLCVFLSPFLSLPSTRVSVPFSGFFQSSRDSP
jgi:hypothetical protein